MLQMRLLPTIPLLLLQLQLQLQLQQQQLLLLLLLLLQLQLQLQQQQQLLLLQRVGDIFLIQYFLLVQPTIAELRRLVDCREYL